MGIRNTHALYYKKIKCKLVSPDPNGQGQHSQYLEVENFISLYVLANTITRNKGRVISLCDQNFPFVLSLKKKLSPSAQ